MLHQLQSQLGPVDPPPSNNHIERDRERNEKDSRDTRDKDREREAKDSRKDDRDNRPSARDARDSANRDKRDAKDARGAAELHRDARDQRDANRDTRNNTERVERGRSLEGENDNKTRNLDSVWTNKQHLRSPFVLHSLSHSCCAPVRMCIRCTA